MNPIVSRVDPHSDTFKQNLAENLAGVGELMGHLAAARAGGGEKYNQRHKERGKLLPRERIDRLLDRDSPFLELLPLAGLHEGGIPGGSLVAGIGYAMGTPVMVGASESTIQGGAIGPIGLKKSTRIGEIAWENHLPMLHLIESAGADLPNQADIFVPGGAGFRHITQRSAARLPTIAMVFGSCTAGGAYIPGMSDYTVMVKGAAFMYLAGPPLVKMALGEVVDDESLGGAEMHAKLSGVTDYVADDEVDCLRLGRELVGRIGWQRRARPRGPGDAPLYDVEEVLGIASPDVKVPFEAREIIARLVDGSRFAEFKPLYGSTLVTGFAELAGWRIGVLANNGILHSDSANKGAQFIQLCNQTNTPLLFLQNITGFMVGRAAEETGIIKAGAKLINAVSNSTVPAVTVMIGGSYGAGNYAMMGRAYRPRFLFTWPNHKIAVMGPDQLAGVIDIVKREAAQKQGKPVDEEQLAGLKMMLSGKIAHESTSWAATGRMFDDGVIDPRTTREVLALVYTIIHETGEVTGTSVFGTFRH